MYLRVDIFSSPHCNVCGQASEMLNKLSDEFGADKLLCRKVNVLEEIDLAVSLGVLSTPAIVIDDELVFAGLPSANKLRDELLRRLEKK